MTVQSHPVQELAAEVRPETAKSGRSSLSRLLFSGSSTLGMASLIERGLGFIANLAAARLGGAHTFGAYAVAMNAANNVAAYAGAGIGTTANRFSGEYSYGHSGYGSLLRSLSVVSLSSAAIAATALWIAAEPLATHLLRNPGLTNLLRLAALSAGVVILFECFRGLLIGQRRFAALLSLCALSGCGMLAFLPLAAKRGASAMVMVQVTVAATAIVTCVMAARRLRLAPPPTAPGATGTGPRPGLIMRFGLVQLAGTIGLNAAGWWVAALVARADISLVQAGCFSAATQLRNVCAMPSSLISQTAYAQMTERGGREYGGPGRVTLMSTFAATMVSLLIAGPAAALMPWIIPHLYGKDFAAGELAATLAVATGLVHMSAAPAADRLTIVSLPLTGVINGFWAVLLVALGTWWVPGGGAAEAVATFLAAHIFSALAVLVTLLHREAVPRAVATVSMPSLAGALVLAGLGWWRANSPHKPALSLAMLAATAGLASLTFRQGQRHSSVLQNLTVSRLITGIFSRLSRHCGMRKLSQD